VLVAAAPGLGVDTARVLVAERGRAWFKDVADFEARLKSRSPDANPDVSRLATTSRHFLVTGRARFGVAMVRMEVLLDRSQNWPTIVWQKLL
jgi:general secretion pathway protein K